MSHRLPSRGIALAAAFLLSVAGPALAQSGAPGAEPSRYLAQRLDQMREHLLGLVRAIPELPADLHRAGVALDAAAGGAGALRIALGAALCLLAGLALEGLVRWAATALRPRQAAEPRRVAERLLRIGMGALRELLALGGFAVGALILLELQTRTGPIHEAGVALLVAVLVVRLSHAALTLLLQPGPAGDRALACFDLEAAAARSWHRHLLGFVAWFAMGWAIVSALRALGLPREALQLLAYLLGLGLVAIAIAIAWRPPAAAAAGEAPAGRARRWLATIAIVLLWLEWAAGAMTLFWLMVVAIGLPLAIAAARRAARHVMRPVAGDAAPATASVHAVLVEQGLRAALIVAAIFLLLWGWDLDVGSIAERETTLTRLVRGVMNALIILLLADLAWNVIKALADRTLAGAQPAAALDPEESRRRARIRTLLPIGRNVAFIVLLVMAGLMALSALGVEIGPLIASAGVVGVAVGFGAQTVVRDIISGMFYMLDDAFRVGEYIQSGQYKGTVESFSLRSVKLRHQRGPLFTVPFGVLGAVQNMSRDWVVVKDAITITYDSDIEKARKLVKQIGAELAADPVFGPNILQPLKMQAGVQQFGEYGMVVRTKMMTKPGEQFMVRRKANAMIKKAFDENGVRFALPRVQVADGGEGNGDAAAAVAAAQQVRRPPPPDASS